MKFTLQQLSRIIEEGVSEEQISHFELSETLTATDLQKQLSVPSSRVSSRVHSALPELKKSASTGLPVRVNEDLIRAQVRREQDKKLARLQEQ